MRRVSAGNYATLDGHYLIERQDGLTICEHPLCDTLHQRFHTYNAGDRQHVVEYVQWHVWDDWRDDYAAHDSREFDTLTEARAWLDSFLAKASAS